MVGIGFALSLCSKLCMVLCFGVRSGYGIVFGFGLGICGLSLIQRLSLRVGYCVGFRLVLDVGLELGWLFGLRRRL